MSDTDDDLVPNSFHKYPHENNVIHTQLSKSRYGSYNNMMTSNFNMPQRFMGFDQRSMYSRRETSPMSLRSFPNSRMPYQQPYSLSAMSSRGSVNNARCRSPVSVLSTYSNATVSAADIASALKNEKFTKNDERIIREAYNSFKKSRMRKRIGKRRNLKLFLKYCRRNSGGESGAEGSNSSLSSDDCRSTKSAFYTRDMTITRARPPRVDLNTFTRQLREDDNYRDCTENFKQNSFRNLLTVQNRNVKHSFLPHYKQQNVTYDNRYPAVPKTRENQCPEPQNAPVVTLKDRLAKDTSLLLPIQRFNMSNANPSYEISYKVKSKTAPQEESASNNRLEESDDESEEIFAPSTSRVNLTQSSTLPQKRALETESVSYPGSKRKKLSTSPVKQNKSASSKNMKKITTNTKDFNFKKPLLPVRKLGTLVRDDESEILIAKSSQHLVGNVEPLPNQLKKNSPVLITPIDKLDTTKQTQQPPQNHIDTIINNSIADTTQNSTNVSMKPSFTKRKLFTQTLDITENKNISNDNLDVNSPQTKVLRTCREKNKVRKLTSQSCLSRDVSDKNYMDLLHKFLPSDQSKNQTLNSTNVANKEEASKRNPVKVSNWDVSLAVSMCENNEGSDTYTDEEIFNGLQKHKDKTNKELIEKRDSPKKTVRSCINSFRKTDFESDMKDGVNPSSQKRFQKDLDSPKRTARYFIKNFWETDFESDMEEDGETLFSQKRYQKDLIPRNSQFLMNGTNGIGATKKSRGTILSARNLNKQGMNQTNETQKLKDKMHDINQQENKENLNDNMLNRRSRSVSKNTNAKLQQTEPIRNKIDTCNNSNILNRRSRSVSKNTTAKLQKTEPIRINKIDTCNDSNNSNRRSRSVSKNTKAKLQQTESIRNKIDTCNDLNNSNRRSQSVSKNTRAKLQKTEPIRINKIDTCNDSNNSNRRSRSVSKNSKAKLQQTESIRNKIDTCNDLNNLNRRSRSVSKNTRAKLQKTEPTRINKIDTCNDSNNSNRRSRSVSKNSKAKLQQAEPIRNKIDTCNDLNNSNRRSRSVSKNIKAKLQQTEPIRNNKIDTCNNSNNSNRRSRSILKNTKANLQQTEPINNNKINTCNVSNYSNCHCKAKNQRNNNPQKAKLRTPSSKKNNKQPQSIFNISRESLRLKQKKKSSLNNSSSINHSKSPEVESHKCNTSRESMRLKQKREASLNNSSLNDIKSPENKSHAFNTSKRSMRLKRKREARLNDSSTNAITSPENESHAFNTSKRSMRLRQKREARLNNSSMNDITSPEN